MTKKTLFLLFGLIIPFLGRAAEHDDNALIVCENSKEMLAWNLQFIEKAKHSVEISLCFTGGTVFRALMEAAEKKINENPQFQVHFLAAPVLLEEYERNLIKNFEEKYPGQFHLQLTDSLFEPIPEYYAIDNHLKICIVDEEYYSLGGTNFDEFLCGEGTSKPPRREGEGIARNTLPGGMRDQDVVGKGPIAKEIRKVFFKHFALWEHFFLTNHFEVDPEKFAQDNRYFEIPSGDRAYLEAFEKSAYLRQTPLIKVLVSGPMDHPNRISKEYAALINRASKEIKIANLYCCPVEYITDAFKGAVQRGVSLEYITNGIWDGSPMYANFIGWANRINFIPLFYGREFRFWDTPEDSPLCKTRIFEYRVPDTMYHKKVMVIDNHLCVIGTYNLGKRSDLGDYEIILVIDSKEVAADLIKVMERDKTLSEEITPEMARSWYFDPAISYYGSVQQLFHGFL